jgi:hypothetical protein
MVLITGNALGSGLTWTLGHPDLFVKKIAIVWMETVIKKLPRGHPVVKKELERRLYLVQTKGFV